jgi:hypothetical protein
MSRVDICDRVPTVADLPESEMLTLAIDIALACVITG